MNPKVGGWVGISSQGRDVAGCEGKQKRQLLGGGGGCRGVPRLWKNFMSTVSQFERELGGRMGNKKIRWGKPFQKSLEHCPCTVLELALYSFSFIHQKIYWVSTGGPGVSVMGIQWPSGQLDLNSSWSSELNAGKADSKRDDYNCIWKAHLGCPG